MNIAFIGCGKLGMPCAEEIAKKGHTVTGYDVATVTSELVTVCDNIDDTVKDASIVFVAVPVSYTHLTLPTTPYV